MKHVETGARSAVTVLVTGFGAFPGAPRNPTATMLRALERDHARRLQRLGIALRTALMPVVYDEIATALDAAVSLHRPQAILHLGLAGRRRALCVETRALNRAGPLHPDAAGRRAAPVLVPGGAAIRKSRYPVLQVLAAVRAQRLPAHRSIDAGGYVCNATLYRTLDRDLAPVAGFLHVPKVRNRAQPCRRTRYRRPDSADLARGALAVVLVMARAARAKRLRDRGRAV